MMRQRSSTGSDSRSTSGGRGAGTSRSTCGAGATPGRCLSMLCEKAFPKQRIERIKAAARIACARIEKRRDGAADVAKVAAGHGDVARADRARGIVDAGAQAHGCVVDTEDADQIVLVDAVARDPDRADQHAAAVDGKAA